MRRILNVGCGGNKYGTDFVDVYPARPEVKKCNIDKEKLPYKDGTFDIVFSRNVFEHLRNPGFVLEEMFRVLKKGGELELITDNANYWAWAVGRTHLGGYEHNRGREEDKHFSLFTEWHLRQHLKEVGLKVTSVEFIGEKFLPNKFLGKIFKKIVNFILRRTPLRRMGYARIRITGKKP